MEIYKKIILHNSFLVTLYTHIESQAKKNQGLQFCCVVISVNTRSEKKHTDYGYHR